MLSKPKESNNTSVAAVILAAGESKRLGQPKQLLDFKGKTFIENVIEETVIVGLSPIIVVLGFESEKIQEKLDKYSSKIKIVINHEWETGQSSSLRVAIPSLFKNTYSIFLLADQPQITSALLIKLVQTVHNTRKNIVATFVGGIRSNPVAFSRDLFPELAEIKGDQGGRFLFGKYEIEKMEWEDERILIDVDTPEDYARLKQAYGLE